MAEPEQFKLDVDVVHREEADQVLNFKIIRVCIHVDLRPIDGLYCQILTTVSCLIVTETINWFMKILRMLRKKKQSYYFNFYVKYLILDYVHFRFYCALDFSILSMLFVLDEQRD